MPQVGKSEDAVKLLNAILYMKIAFVGINDIRNAKYIA